MRVTLISGRTIDQGTGKEHGKMSQKYRESVALCEIDPDDLKDIGIAEGANVKVSTEFGAITVRGAASKRAPHPKIVYMPYGPWANMIMGPATHGTGMPSFKGIPAEIEPAVATDRVLTLQELLKQTFRKA